MAAVTIKRLTAICLIGDLANGSPSLPLPAPGGPSPSSVTPPLRPRSQNNKCSPPSLPHQQLTRVD